MDSGMTNAETGDGTPCCRCGAHPGRPGRCARGHALPGGGMGAASRFPPGEPGPNLRHGLRSEVHRERRLAERRGEVEALMAEITRALGGTLDALQAVLVKRLAVAAVLVTDFDDELLGGGCSTVTKRTRRAVAPHERYTDRIARLVGQLRAGKGADPSPNVAELFAQLHEDRDA